MARAKEPWEFWDDHCAEHDEWLQHRQVCDGCGEHIADDYCYEINDEHYCEECLQEYFRIDTPTSEDENKW